MHTPKISHTRRNLFGLRCVFMTHSAGIISFWARSFVSFFLGRLRPIGMHRHIVSHTRRNLFGLHCGFMAHLMEIGSCWARLFISLFLGRFSPSMYPEYSDTTIKLNLENNSFYNLMRSSLISAYTVCSCLSVQMFQVNTKHTYASNICCGYSKEPSQRAPEMPKHMFILMSKKMLQFYTEKNCQSRPM